MRARNTKRAVVVVFTLVALGLMPRCEFKHTLRKTEKRFIQQLQKGDYKGFKESATDRLRGEVSEKAFLRLSQAFRKLGPIKKRTQGSYKKSHGYNRLEGTFRYKFSSARVHLRIVTSEKGWLDTFSFHGGGLEKITGNE